MITATPTPTSTPDDTDRTLQLRKQEPAARQEAAAAAAPPPPPPATAMGDLIPGLPEDMARECLLRVGFQHLPTARRVSRGWKAELESPSHHRSRRRRRHALLALAQTQPPLAASGPARKYAAAYSSFRLVLHDPAAGSWTPLPAPAPPGGDRLPLFCQLAAAGDGPAAKLLVLGGWDPDTWSPTGAVHVYDFLSGAWRRGADMPPPRRSFFACAAAVGGTGTKVFVAGGHDEEKNALRSAVAYDAEADAWTPLPDMATERDEPRGVCVAGGRFVVVGGYPTQAQGRFVGSAETFDPATWSWAPVQERVVEDGACPRTCCADAAAEGSRIYMLRDGCVVARDGDEGGGGGWRALARLPEDARAATTVVSIGDGRVVVLGAEQTVYVLCHEKEKPSWTRVAAPPEFAGHVQAACCVQI